MKEIKIKTHKIYKVIGNVLLDEKGNYHEFRNRTKMAEYLGISRQALYTKSKVAEVIK